MRKLSKKRLKEIRLKSGLTQTQLAEYLGLSSQTRISEYEKGIRNPSPGITKIYQLIEQGAIIPKKLKAKK